jgi:hypothetical protein
VSEPEHVTLAREAWEAGLVVTHLMPALYGGRYNIVAWRPDGTPWVEARDQSPAMIRAHIAHWPAHQQAQTGLRLVIPGDGAALDCGCLIDTTDPTEEGQ